MKPATRGKRLLALRIQAKVTKAELSRLAGIERSEVTRLETGANAARTQRMQDALARAYRVSRDDLARYLDGDADLVELLAAQTGHEALETALRFHDGRWSTWSVEAARELARHPDQGLTPSTWVEVLDSIEQALGAIKERFAPRSAEVSRSKGKTRHERITTGAELDEIDADKPST